ncbi:MAG: hypothetical protein COB85_02040 [Bacteroidetes bacterium]|nr:MAG: hypothetical protein COB85_02040 [Bacteroidota bacterium]
MLQKANARIALIGILFISGILYSNKSDASHAMGMDLTYICLGGNDYEFTVNLYRDCSGINAPASLTININSASCGSSNTLLLTATGPGVDISPLCASALSTCSGGSNPGVEHWEYKGTFTLPMNCPDWNFSYALCCRNNSITNLVNASSESLYVESTLDNSTGLCNASPNFSTLPVPYICKGQLVNYNLGAYDADGDSLVYSLINALGAGGTPIAYVVPYTPTYPITTDSGFVTFDTLTGNLNLAPDTFQTCIVTVLVEEYRNGVLIGSIMRDIQVLVLDCPGNIQPNIVSPLITNFSGGGVLLDSNSIEVCVGIPVYFDLTGVDPDTADSIFLITNLSTVIPSATFDTTGINPVLGSFSWIPTNSDLGLNTFSVTVEDNSCPIIGRQTYLFEIRVLQGVYAGPDINLCGTDSIQLLATGSATYSWSPGSGLSDSTISNPMALPSSTTTYIVTGDSTGACKYVDTITISVVADFTLTTSPDTIMCDVAGVGISASTNPAGTYTFLWAPGATLDDDTISNPLAAPISTTLYSVTVTSAAGCEKIGSVNVTVNDPISVNIFPGDTTICPGSSFVLNSGVTGSDMQDDFDPGIDMSQWITVVATASNSCGSVSGNALYFDDNGVREAITFDLNVSGGGTIEFYLKIANGTGAPCESADINEDVVLEYSINGGATWLIINTYDQDLFPSFTFLSVAVPIAAQTSATRFKWRQLQHSGNCCDHWAMDEISITGSGGSFGYAWSPAAGLSATNIPTPTASPSVTTTYTVDVSNFGNGCVVSDSVTITVLPEMTLTMGSVNATCDSSDGTAFVSVAGGVAPINYLWDDSLSQVNDSALSVPAGAYTVLVTDSNGCSKSDIVSVNDDGAATVSIVTSSDVSCFGGSNGSAEIGATGGSPPYTYSWNDPGSQTDSVAVGLSAGTYSGTVSDSNGCEAIATVVINEPLIISTFMNGTDATCGLPNGEATVLVSGGTGSFTYLWTDTASQTTAVATALGPGIYYITVTDSLNCTVTDSVEINSVNAPSATIIGSNVTFYGGNDGFAIVSASGGSTPYTYLWDDPLAQTSLLANTLTAGTYTVTVTDADTCFVVVSITITQPPAIDVSVVSIDSLGTSCTQVIMVTMLNYGDTLFAGDTIPMVYDVNSNTVLEDFVLPIDFNTGTTVTYSFSTTANLYGAGTYNVSSWSMYPGDGDNSNDTAFATITSTSPLSVNVTADTLAVCYGDTANLESNINSSVCSAYTVAAASFAPMAGTGTAVSLTDDQLSTVLPIGFDFVFYCNTYTNFHISSNGYITFDASAGNGCCSGQTLPNTFDPNDLIAFAWSDLDPGGGAGTIEYFTVGTAPNRVLVVNFIGVPHFPGPSPNNDVTSQVLLYETTNAIEIHTTNMPTDGGIHTMGIENIDGTDALAVAGRNGTTTWSATNEAYRFAPLQLGGYSVQWIDQDSVLIDTLESIAVAPDSTVTYIVIVTDLSNGCTVIDSITIAGSSQIVLTMDSVDASCGNADGIASVSVVGGVAPLTYLWDDPGTQTTDTANSLNAGPYTVIVTAANGCSAVASVIVVNPGAPTVSISSTNNVSCSGENDGSANVTTSGGTSPYTYLWNDPSSQSDSLAVGLTVGTYTVSVTDNANCLATATTTITEPSIIVLSMTSVDANSCSVPDGKAWVTVTGGTIPYSYSWDDPGTQTTDTAFALSPGNYTVIVTDGNGCMDSIGAVINDTTNIVLTLTKTDVTSCISPNGDASVAVTGGATPYTYLWNDPGTQATATANGLVIGIYTVQVSDANGCLETDSISVNFGLNVSFTVFPGDTSVCSGTSVQLDATVIITSVEDDFDPGVDLSMWSSISNGVANTDCGSMTGLALHFNSSVAPREATTISMNATSCTSIDFCMQIGTGTAPCENADINESVELQYSINGGTSWITIVLYDQADWDASPGWMCFSEPVPVGAQTSATLFRWVQPNFSLCVGCDNWAIDNVVINCNTGGPFSYTWTPSAGLSATDDSNPTASPTSSTTYVVDVTDSVSGCVFTDSISVTIFPEMTITTSGTDATCGLTNGTASVTVVGGTTPLIFLWDDPSFQTNDTATSLDVGTYIVLVTDSNGCSQSGSVNVSNVGAPSVDSSFATSVSCNGGINGSAGISVSGGSLPYSYIWNDPGTQSNATATGLDAGSYNVTVLGSDSCTSIATIMVTEPTLLTANATATTASCGANDGQAIVVGSGGTGIYTYLWDDSLAQVTDTAINLAAGTYSVTITDANGCTTTASATVANPSAPSVTVTSSDVSCYGAADGEGTLFATGGTTPYTFTWDDPGTQTNANATGLSGGNFTGTVTDALGCLVSATITLSEPPNVTFPYLETFDSDSAYDASSSPGAPIILLDNGWINDQNDGSQDWAPRSIATVSGNTGPAADHTSGSGNYIYVEDGMDNDSVSLLSPCMNISALCTPELSFWYHSYTVNASNSILHLDIKYLGVWNMDIITPIVGEIDAWQNKLVDLSPYPDAITIRFRVDNNNGTPFHDIAIDDVEVYDMTGFATSSSALAPSCPGDSNGSASVSVDSGGVAPFTYLWDDPGTQTNAIVTGLSDGTYTATITDSAGCESVIIITITDPLSPVLSMTTTASSCPGATDGTATVSITSGGISPFSYLWNDPGTQTDSVATGLAAGTYSVLITDSNSCTTIDSVTVSEGVSTTTLSLTSMATTCIGVCDGQATVTVSGGTPPYTYSWNDPGTQTNATAINLCIGSFTATVSDAQGCSISDTVSVVGPSALVATVTNIDSASLGTSDGSATVSVTGGNPPYTYLWNDGQAQTNATATGLPAGTYTCTVTDASGCITIISVTVPQAINPGVFEYEGVSKFDIYPNPTKGKAVFDIELNETGTVELLILNVLGEVIYSERISQVSKFRYEVDLSYLQNGVYFIQLTSENVNANKSIVITK